MNQQKNSNRLADEKSPYLLQHANNPIDWYPWGKEAFRKAKNENKPIFLSIGYSTCHWCHVMERESFEDREVAELINSTFIPIKVDREERPDIDQIYMLVCQMMTGSGGWPLTIFLTPDKKPFFAGTYIPKDSIAGRKGLVELAAQVKEIWKERKDEVLQSAEQITNALDRISRDEPGVQLDQSLLDAAYKQLEQRFDRDNGGFGTFPKFPNPHTLSFLLRYWRRTGNEMALEMVEKTLKEMCLGGIFDHVGLGFHRYSTDARWFAPHFEKMLYDQALLAISYTEAYQTTKKPEYKKTAEEIFTYVSRDMTSPDGAFFSAEDADSEGVEGKFYTWTEKEIRKVLDEHEADLFIKTFGIEKDGNFEKGTNILFLKNDIEDIEKFEQARKKLFNAREKRIHPHKDDKILTDWNGLMIAAFAKSGSAFKKPEYVTAAKSAADFILAKMSSNEGRLLHRYRDGEAAIPGYLDDYAFFVWGLLEIYEATFEKSYLHKAVKLNDQMLKYFWDESEGGLFFTADDSEELISRQKVVYDGAITSGNSVAMMNLLRLAGLTAKPEYAVKASEIAKTFANTVRSAPSGYTHLMSAFDYFSGPSYEVTITGNPKDDDTQAMIDALRDKFLPSVVVTLHPSDAESKASAQVCKNRTCLPPVNTVQEMLELLK